MYNFSNLSLSDLKALRDLSEVEFQKWCEWASEFNGSEEEKKNNEDHQAAIENRSAFNNLVSHINEELHKRIYKHLVYREW